MTVRYVVVETEFAGISADTLWNAFDKDTLEAAAKDMVRFYPSEALTGSWQAGKTIQLEVSAKLFGIWLPRVAYAIHTESITDLPHEKALINREHGGIIKSWMHHMVVRADKPHSCTMIDHIVVDAGWLSLPVSWWVKRYYQHRQDWLLEALTKVYAITT
jgi:hypothetical protein